MTGSWPAVNHEKSKTKKSSRRNLILAESKRYFSIWLYISLDIFTKRLAILPPEVNPYEKTPYYWRNWRQHRFIQRQLLTRPFCPCLWDMLEKRVEKVCIGWRTRPAHVLPLVGSSKSNFGRERKVWSIVTNLELSNCAVPKGAIPTELLGVINCPEFEYGPRIDLQRSKIDEYTLEWAKVSQTGNRTRAAWVKARNPNP